VDVAHVEGEGEWEDQSVTPQQFIDVGIMPALSLLPAKMSSPEAIAQLVAIGMQESGLMHRKQINGPANGLLQFELGGGIAGVLRHQETRDDIRKVLKALCYGDTPMTSYNAIEHNDVLACAYGRLLLWTEPKKLPTARQPDEGWRQYLNTWRPGRPHPSTWRIYYDLAWSVVADVGVVV
jgi:hypothetical protein